MKTALIALLLFVMPASLWAQEEDIANIRKWYKSVEGRLKTSEVKKLMDFEDTIQYSGMAGEVEAWYDANEKQYIKIVENGYADWHMEKASFYFKDGEVFFIFIETESAGEMYTAEELGVTDEELWQSGGEAKTMNYTQERIYIKDNKCIRYLVKEKDFPAEDKEHSLKDVKNKDGDMGGLDMDYYTSHIGQLKLALKKKK